MKVPLVDLKAQNLSLVAELTGILEDSIKDGVFVGGRQVEAFEEEFAAFCGSRFCVGCSSGTDALRFALLASGIGRGQEVITVPFTFAATLEAIIQAGARPVLVDVDEVTCTIDPNRVEDYLKKRLKGPSTLSPRAILPVHLYGHPADMDPIMEIAGNYDLMVVEDACQAHGAKYFSRLSIKESPMGQTPHGVWLQCGTIGLAGAFSFYPTKNLGALGEAGAVVTDNEAVASKVRMLRDHGQAGKYIHTMEGYNGRLDAIQAGILRLKLKHLSSWNDRRRYLAKRYAKRLSHIAEIKLPPEAPYARPVYCLYTLRTKRRDELKEFLSKKGVGWGVHYPMALHLQEAYRSLGYKQGDFPVSERLAREVISIPLYPELSEEKQDLVIEALVEFFESPWGS